ncbi:hypothetical protein OKA04_16230 [Luteolibacter flavescens]|uniref:Uncharacterized protein n=1 Tax=Luteolibacter flavescens TaxID=1859460 RepID=A0ABT3FRR7_9BACT|nr:hypothetical protein [Luteolibacter flavescens]MCW1886286.1 hypothetical protein [Luteolibacter flavescens]
MANPHDTPDALKELQDAIYREKVLRARELTPGERCSDVFELSTFQFHLMHAGAMKRLGTDDHEAGWKEVRRSLDRLAKVHEAGLYTTTPPLAR